MMMSEEFGKIPKRATKGSAGYDIVLPNDETFYPGVFKTLDTGLSFDGKEVAMLISSEYHNEKAEPVRVVGLPFRWVALIFPRSSLGFEYGMRFANTICVIDQDYRNNIKLSITVDEKCEMHRGDRIAQMIVIPYCIFMEEDTPFETRTGGIGSTGR